MNVIIKEKCPFENSRKRMKSIWERMQELQGLWRKLIFTCHQPLWLIHATGTVAGRPLKSYRFQYVDIVREDHGQVHLKSWQNLRIQWSMNADLDFLFKELAQSCPEIRESMGKLWNFSAVKSDAMILPILSTVGILGLRLHLVILHILEHRPSHVLLFREHVKGHICHRLDPVRLLALRAQTSTSALAAAGLSSGTNLQLQEFCD